MKRYGKKEKERFRFHELDIPQSSSAFLALQYWFWQRLRFQIYIYHTCALCAETGFPLSVCWLNNDSHTNTSTEKETDYMELRSENIIAFAEHIILFDCLYIQNQRRNIYQGDSLMMTANSSNDCFFLSLHWYELISIFVASFCSRMCLLVGCFWRLVDVFRSHFDLEYLYYHVQSINQSVWFN